MTPCFHVFSQVYVSPISSYRSTNRLFSCLISVVLVKPGLHLQLCHFSFSKVLILLQLFAIYLYLCLLFPLPLLFNLFWWDHFWSFLLSISLKCTFNQVILFCSLNTPAFPSSHLSVTTFHRLASLCLYIVPYFFHSPQPLILLTSISYFLYSTITLFVSRYDFAFL